jgi:hypothetical protein
LIARATSFGIRRSLKKEIKIMYPKPSFCKMKGQELVDSFNTYAMTSRRAKFSTNQEGIDCCEAEWKK